MLWQIQYPSHAGWIARNTPNSGQQAMMRNFQPNIVPRKRKRIIFPTMATEIPGSRKRTLHNFFEWNGYIDDYFHKGMHKRMEPKTGHRLVDTDVWETNIPDKGFLSYKSFKDTIMLRVPTPFFTSCTEGMQCLVSTKGLA